MTEYFLDLNVDKNDDDSDEVFIANPQQIEIISLRVCLLNPRACIGNSLTLVSSFIMTFLSNLSYELSFFIEATTSSSVSIDLITASAL